LRYFYINEIKYQFYLFKILKTLLYFKNIYTKNAIYLQNNIKHRYIYRTIFSFIKNFLFYSLTNNFKVKYLINNNIYIYILYD